MTTDTADTADPTTEHEEPPMTATEVPLPPAAEATTTIGPRPAARLAAVLRSEVIKSTTVRTNKVLLAITAIIGLPITWATAVLLTDEVLTVTDVFVYPTAPTAVLAAIAGILLFTAEVQHGTLAGSLTAHPSRWPVVAAKAALATGFGLVLGVVGMAIGFLGALVGGLEVGDTSGVPATVLWVLLYTSGSALLGLGVGMIVRHSAGAVAGRARVVAGRRGPRHPVRPGRGRAVPALRRRLAHARDRDRLRLPRDRRIGAAEPAPRHDLLGLRRRRPASSGRRCCVRRDAD